MQDILKEISHRFLIHGDFVAGQPYGTGHINDTFAVWTDQGGTRVRYLLQRISNEAFDDPPRLMENILRVTTHLRFRLESEAVKDVSRRTLTVIGALDGASCYLDNEGRYWRAYIFIEGARTYDSLQDPRQAYEAARAFGKFQLMVSDLPGEPLHETIPDFHNGPKRLRDFEAALREDRCNRAHKAGPEIEFLYRMAPIFESFQSQVDLGKIPIRTTHNDTKINNVMMDDFTGRAICVIDLDTLMPGSVLYDFGDIVRTSTCRAAEDEQNLELVAVDRAMFEQVVRGYLSSAVSFLNADEKKHLVLGGKMITLIIGCRFLTDFLNGDRYFKIHRPDHNLDRTRTQFHLVQSICDQEEDLEAVVESALKESQ